MRIAALLDDSRFVHSNREFTTWAGTLEGEKISVVSTGIGGPSAAIAVEELHQIGVHTFLRIGTCGGIRLDVQSGDVVVATGAVRMEGTSREYAPIEYPAVPDLDLLNACRTAARRQQAPYQIGIARSHDCMYRDDNPALYETWSRRGVIAADMETATMLGVGRLRGVRCASILNVVAGFHKNVAESVGRYQNGEQAAAAGEHLEICTALDALDVFHQGSSRA